ncbi:MAG TPA: tetratricopeptide repeat protein [Kofleriaceae bacterium]|jgi:tetratricopeptide (TPR) repeat protein|nr:tetratricopeptide repeat protein [Kofleriaceae bacterium]
MMTRASLLLVLAMTTTASAESDALPILKNAIAHDKDPKILQDALTAVDAVIVKNAKDPDAHYARGWLLSRLGKPDDAVTAYDHALQLDPKLADAAYNAGVVLGSLHKDKEATAHFDKALAIDPKHVDAAYNAGQGYYNAKDFHHAAERWATAAKLAPDDFQIAKKVVQVEHAVGNDATAAREHVFALWKAGKAGSAKDYVFDQFDVGARHIFASESFETGGDLAYVYRFDVGDGDRKLGSVNLETSAVIREQGIPYLLGMDKGGTHSQLGKMFKHLPSYKELKPLVIDAIKAKF